MPISKTDLFKIRLEEIRYIKQNEWTLTNYALLLYGAIFAVVKNINVPRPSWLVCLGIGYVVVVFVGATVLLCSIRWDLIELRKSIDRNDPNPYMRGWQFFVAMIMALLGGALLVGISLPYL